MYLLLSDKIRAISFKLREMWVKAHTGLLDGKFILQTPSKVFNRSI